MKLTHTTLTILAGISLSLSVHAADNAVLAKVGTTEIAAAELKPYLTNLSGADREALNSNPALLNQLVRSVILQELLYKEAAQAGWNKKPEVVQQAARAEKNAVVESYLQAVTKLPDSFPSDSEVTALYENRKATLQVPTQYRLAQIFVAVPKGADKASVDAAAVRIDGVKKNLKQSDFAEVARSQSEEPQSAARGGEVGWLAEDAIQPEIKSAVGTLSKNAVSEPIRLNDGWYVIKVLDVYPAHTATLDEVRPQIVKLLQQERLRQNREAYFTKLQQQNPVSINEIGLGSLLTDVTKP